MTKIQLTTYKSIIGSLALETVKNPNNSEDVKNKIENKQEDTNGKRFKRANRNNDSLSQWW